MSKVTEELTRIREILEEGQSGGGGGGGSFKTAKVRITYGADDGGVANINIANIDDDGIVYASAGAIKLFPIDLTVPLGENGAYMALPFGSSYYFTNIEGNIEIQEDTSDTEAIITGDCSVTVVPFGETPEN